VHNQCCSIKIHADQDSNSNLIKWWKQNKLPTYHFLYPQSHKNHDLPDQGRGWIWKYKKPIQQNLYKLNLLIKISKKFRSQKTNPIKAQRLPGIGRGWFIIHYVCWVYLQIELTRRSMASSFAKRQIL
jgi:hypothetical protein